MCTRKASLNVVPKDGVGIVVRGVQQHPDPQRLRSGRASSPGDESARKQGNSHGQRDHLTASEGLPCPRRLRAEQIIHRHGEDPRQRHQRNDEPGQDLRRMEHLPTRIVGNRYGATAHRPLLRPHVCSPLFAALQYSRMSSNGTSPNTTSRNGPGSRKSLTGVSWSHESRPTDVLTGRIGNERDPTDEASDRKHAHHRQQRPKRRRSVAVSRLLSSGCSLRSLRHVHPTSAPPSLPACRTRDV